jgi:uncharacterized protein YggE
MKKTLASLPLASLLLATSLLTGCHDRVIAIAPPAPALEIERPGQMTVSGSATLEVSPDCADLTITLTGEAARPGAASKQVAAKEQVMIAALQKVGVETADLKLSTLSLDPVFEQTSEGVMLARVHGYRAQIVATTRDFAKIPDIMDAAAQAGSSSMSSQFRRSDLSALKKKVRDMALAVAKDKAKQTADALGIKLGRVVSVAENQGGMMWSNQYFPSNASNVQVQDARVALGGTLQPLTLDVTVGYELAKAT